MIFLCDKNENFLLQHCSPSQDAHVCTIWAHYHKLCRDSSHNIGRLDWKPWNLEHDRSFLRRFFWDIWNIPSLIFFLATMSHNMTPREGFTLFGSFLNFLCPFQLWSKRRARRFLARGRASLHLQWISDEIAYCEPKNDFSKKSWALDHVPVVQIWPTSYRFGRNLSFSRGVDGKV